MHPPRWRHGFSLVELLFTLGAIAVILGLLILTYSQPRRGHHAPLKDSAQLRGLHQGLITWAQNNADKFPLPSLIDSSNTTVSDIGPAKDHTANILSPLIYNGTISTEILISAAEASSHIRLCDDYEFDMPKAAVDPAKALWDPALTADFTAERGGNISYAHMLPSGPRLPLWAATCPSSVAMLGNRGPEIASVKAGLGTIATPTLSLPDSVTFLIHGNRSKWEGYVAFADNHVEFISELKFGTYTDHSGRNRDDILFYDEPDDAAGTNASLGIFTKAGPAPLDFKAIWD